MAMSHGGFSGMPPSLKLPTLLKSWNLLQQASNAADNTAHKRHVEELVMQLQYVLLDGWKNYELDAQKLKLKLPGTFDQQFADFTKITARYHKLRINMKWREQALAALKAAYYRNFTTKASQSYGGKPDQAYDDDLKTSWNGGGFKGWLQIEFNTPRTIRSIYTVFNWKNKDVTYEISGSLDGKNWKTLVPKRKTDKSVIIQKLSAYLPVIVAEDKLAPVKIRYLKTEIFRSTQVTGKPDWVVIREQEIQ